MAYLTTVNITPGTYDPTTKDCSPNPSGKVYENIYVIFFENGKEWSAANKYSLSRTVDREVKRKTVRLNMEDLKAYADWLEATDQDWRFFPERKRDRVLWKYRGYLIAQREEGVLAPSTTTKRMASVIGFYRWCRVYGWVERKELWTDKSITIKFTDQVGFTRLMSVVSSDLSIPNRKRQGVILEDGLMPISSEKRDTLLGYLKAEGKHELYLMHMVGFFTGARSETVRTLRVESVENAMEVRALTGFTSINVGPGTRVKTKYDIEGSLICPNYLVTLLKEYAYSARRLRRQAKTSDEDTTLLFLTQNGTGYSHETFKALLCSLRKELMRKGFPEYADFHFHRTRATFGTELAQVALKTLPSRKAAGDFIRDAMLHKDEKTTYKYIDFTERREAKKYYSDEFYELFTGKKSYLEDCASD